MEVTLANVTTPQSLLFGLVLRRLVDQRRLPKRPFQLWILDHALEIRKRLRVLIAPCLVLGVSVSKDRSEVRSARVKLSPTRCSRLEDPIVDVDHAPMKSLVDAVDHLNRR